MYAETNANTVVAAEAALDRFANRLRTTIDMIEGTNKNLHSNADRLLGDRPPEAGGPQAVPCYGPGAVGMVEGLLDDLQGAVLRNVDAASRLRVL